jgi:hypothetical protein
LASSKGEANGSLGRAGVIAGWGVRGPRGDASGLDNLNILGGSGSAKGFRSVSASSPGSIGCEDTLLFFLRKRFLSLFLLDERIMKSPGA